MPRTKYIWKMHAENVSTNMIIMSGRLNTKADNRTPTDFIYKVDGRLFKKFSEAVVATEEHNNAELNPILLHARWNSTREKPYHLYSPKGVRMGQYESLSEIKQKNGDFDKLFPRPSREKVKRRIAAYNDASKESIEATKRAMIEREKRKILAVREAQKLRAKDLERVGNIEGSW